MTDATQALRSHFNADGSTGLPELPTVAQLSPLVWRVLGLNPGPFSLTGTCTYLIGSGERRLLLDCGDGQSERYLRELQRCMQEAGCTGLDAIVITHWHWDHVGGIPGVVSRVSTGGVSPPPVRKFLPQHPEELSKGEGAVDPYSIWPKEKFTHLADGETVVTQGASLRAMHTPGHATDHCCFLLEEEAALFTGDNVLGVGSAVITELDSYMTSLQRMVDCQPRRLYPGHGPEVEDGPAKLREYQAHRLARIQQVRSFMAGLTVGREVTAMSLARALYAGTPESLMEGAAHNVLVVLRALVRQGVVACSDVGRPAHTSTFTAAIHHPHERL